MFMRAQERTFGLDLADDEIESPRKASSSAPEVTIEARNRQNTLESSKANATVESERVARVRRHCNKQNLMLSSWWKSALNSNLQEKKLLTFGGSLVENSLPGRFDRVYQPEKLTQFDRIFSRTWETPVRRSHAAQHTEGGDGEDTTEFPRVISLDFLSSTGNIRQINTDESHGTKGLSIRDFVSHYNHRAQTESTLKFFAEFFDFQSDTNSIDSPVKQNHPAMYKQYCEPMSPKLFTHSPHKIDEFDAALHALHLSPNDVTGVNEVR